MDGDGEGLRCRPFGAIMLAGDDAMSNYLFHCQDCDKEFAQSLHMSEVEKGQVKCPHCGSNRVHQLVASFSAVTARKS